MLRKLRDWWNETPWQDKIFSFGGVVFAATLLPTVLSSEAAAPLWTSIPTAIMLTVFGIAYFTMKYWWALSTNIATAIMWWLVVFLRHL